MNQCGAVNRKCYAEKAGSLNCVGLSFYAETIRDHLEAHTGSSNRTAQLRPVRAKQWLAAGERHRFTPEAMQLVDECERLLGR